jgi:hypothetical protein
LLDLLWRNGIFPVKDDLEKIMSKHSKQLDQLLQLIDNVYEAALDGGRWRSLAPEIAETFGSTSTTLQM